MVYPLHRYRSFANLTLAEEQALLELGDPPVVHHRGETFQREGESVQGFYLHIAGWIISSVVLRNGDRLIQKVHLPGDMLGTPNAVLAKTADSLTAITEATTAFVPFARFGQIFVDLPRLGALFTVAIQMERLRLLDMLATSQNASSSERLAQFLLDLYQRLETIGFVEGDAFHIPLTQEQMGDLLGITPVHMNRTLRTFDKNGWIARYDHHVKLLDIAALRAISPLPLRCPAFEPSWLPSAR
ncbi:MULTISPECIES: Crp/Fnr family transcriptional regulator [unclassified Sphingomonas]|uniref:Crp/Fnr family transcriptional regulator n=1 Tax=unclassified Sphingomonas TaxID=196159 RepID=UPI000B183F6D|nr:MULTISPECIES: Crp/Fnr family transcriptional regulator [unclassified Sphingomonas]